MRTSILRRAAPVAAVGAVAATALALAPASGASVSSAPCGGKQLVKLPLTINGKLVAKAYIFDEGSQLCAVTTSVGTAYYGQKKYMDVNLWHVNGRSDDRDAGFYRYYAGRIRVKDTHSRECFKVTANVRLPSGSVGDTSAGCAGR